VRVTGCLVVAVCLALLEVAPASAQVLAPPFDDDYSLHDLGAPPDVPPNLGGLTLKQGTTDRLLIGGFANAAGGGLYEIGVTRDAEGHIAGFDGTATRFADADNNDGGVAYGPGGTLFLARYPLTQLGQIRPGSTTTDKIIDLTAHGVTGSLGALAFVPAGFPGAGSLKLASYSGGQWYDAEVVPDGSGTYDLFNVTAIPNAVLSGPEGIVYVNPGSAEFGATSVLVSEYSANRVSAYAVDDNGDPLVGTRRDFVTGLSGAEGAFVDPVTGDFLFSTYGGGNRVIVVRGFARAATLSVVTQVVNDDIGTLGPEAFTVHVRRDGQEVDGSPQRGSAGGTRYTLEDGIEHAVEADPNLHYTLSYSGDCSADGRVTPAEGVERMCVVTADDDAPTVNSGPPVTSSSAAQQQELPPPEAGKEVNALPKGGTVKVRLRGSNRFVELEEGEQIPVGSVIDTTRGRVTIVAAGDQQADFYDGIFRLSQGKGARPLTTLTLVEKLSCPKAGNAVAAAKKKKRRLWGDGTGKFKTNGKHSAATVVGTKWLVEDRCSSTLTKVTRGKVRVRDFAKRRNVIVRAGKKYVARAKP
jgi:hypothetical protein